MPRDVQSLIVWLTAALAAIFAAVGGALVFLKDSGKTDITLFGQKISSSSVGTVALFIGAVMAITIFARVISSVTPPTSKAESHVEKNPLVISWDEMIVAATKLASTLGSSKGYRPDLILGICGGGLVFADMLSKRLGHIPCLSLWADRFGPGNKSVFAEPQNKFNRLRFDQIFMENNVKRVLVVDDVSYSGETLKSAVDFLREQSKSVSTGDVFVKTAVLFSLQSATIRPDYAALTDSQIRKISPASDALR
jgi:hypoxanthine phosphoribosyltransferase